MKDEMLRFIQEQTQVSFAELERHFGEQAAGEYVLFAGASNVILWDNVSEEFVLAFRKLQEDNLIRMTPTSPLTYLINGRVLKYPLAKRVLYSSTHWLPVILKAMKSSIKSGSL